MKLIVIPSADTDIENSYLFGAQDTGELPRIIEKLTERLAALKKADNLIYNPHDKPSPEALKSALDLVGNETVMTNLVNYAKDLGLVYLSEDEQHWLPSYDFN